MKVINKKTIKSQNQSTNALLKQTNVYVDAHSKNILYEQGIKLIKRREVRNNLARKER